MSLAMRVCIVDDDPLLLESLAIAVTGMGHEPCRALNVTSALEIIAQGVDAAVVDILMPDRDGLDLIMAARASHPDLRIVAMSGGGRIGSNALLSMAKGLGADAMLPKPFSATDLEIALRP
jgi:DNA-binding NtrC family response regulator